MTSLNNNHYPVNKRALHVFITFCFTTSYVFVIYIVRRFSELFKQACFADGLSAYKTKVALFGPQELQLKVSKAVDGSYSQVIRPFIAEDPKSASLQLMAIK